MSIHQNSPIDREKAERIFRGDPAARASHPRLDGLLTAAAAPAGARETAGEDAAVAAFAAAHLASSPVHRRTSTLKSALAKLLTVKMVAACVAVGSAGGVALAASTGALPSPLHNPAASHSAGPSHSARPQPSGSPSRGLDLSAPGAELLKLCQRYAADPGGKRFDDLDRPEFGKLVRGAGRKNRDHVDRFCARVLESSPSGMPSDFPGDPDYPDDPRDPGDSHDPGDASNEVPDDLPSENPPARPSDQPDDGAAGESGPRSGSLPSDMPVPPPSGR